MFEGTLILASSWQRAPHHRQTTRRFRLGTLLHLWAGRLTRAHSSVASPVRGGDFTGGTTRQRSRQIGGRVKRRVVGAPGQTTWTRLRSLANIVGALRFISTVHGLPISTRSKRGGMFPPSPFTNLGQGRLLMLRWFYRSPASTTNTVIVLPFFPCTRFTPPRKRCANLWNWRPRPLGCMPHLLLNRHPTPNDVGTSG